jgi:hypothetical protein
MKSQRVLIVLTVFNLLLLGFSLSQIQPASAADPAPILRGRALEIVDDRGRVRASISVLPADPDFKMPDGTRGYPETVLLRLITAEGRPNVKLGTTADGAGLLVGGSDPTYVQILAEGAQTTMRLNEKGAQRVIEP